MDGIFVAYHSTARFYGFQYLPITEMDEALFGTHETGKQVFKLAVGMLERLLQEATECFEGESVRVTWAADTKRDVLRLFVSPDRPEVKKEEVEEGEGEKFEKVPMTLLEVRGTNYIDGEVSYDPVVIESPTNSTGEVPVWQAGYEITRSTGAETEQVPATSDSSSSTKVLNARQISDLFNGVRETQKMFSSLMLPTGVSPKDIQKAAERAKKSGVELDSSDLSIRFPLVEGMTYRGPSAQAQDLRKMSREGKERTLLEEKERQGEKRIVVNSTLDLLD